MAWWGWILIGALIASTGFIVYLVVRSKRSQEEQPALSKEQTRALLATLEEERKAKADLEKQAADLQTTLRQIQAEHNKALADLQAETQNEKDRLASDPDALHDELDRLLIPEQYPKS